MAAELSAKMAIGVMSPIFGQIEPMKVGENARAMNITRHYGIRLVAISKGLTDMSSLDFLVNSYPDHGFVIDRKEAAIIYKDVKEPDSTMEEFIEALGTNALYPPTGKENGVVHYLSTSAEPPRAALSKKGESIRVQNSKKTRKGAGGGGPRTSRDSGTGTSRSANRTNGHKAPSNRI